MEKFLFSKIETWVVLLLTILGLVGCLVFGAVVLDRERGKERTGKVGDAAVAVAALPDTLLRWTREKDGRLANRTEQFDGRSGWTVTADIQTNPIDGYLLLSRTAIEEDRSLVELVDLSDFSVRHVWRPDADGFLSDLPQVSEITDFARWNTRMFEPVHPLLMENGDLIVKDHQTPAVRIDACSNVLWRNADRHYHHSTEVDANGNLWIPSVIDPPSPENGPTFFEDGLALLSPDGKLLSEVSLPKVMEDNGLGAMIFTAGGYLDDGLHLNDIQPALTDSLYWQKGDLFLSLRHKSLILQYRPSTGKIVWMKQGPWLAQHDVDILDDHRIAVFNNNAFSRGKGWWVDGSNEVTVYDFATDTVTNPYHDTLLAEKATSLTEGLFDMASSGHVVIEEENRGRILILDQAGKLVADFVNRAPDGQVYGLGWSRWISRAEGDRALKAANAQVCG
ncbi:MAG TPA: arylsulfotransferase family protein [Paracoccaceae bacterium]|nr:arylsulfotransferase family protein [Paracoccaceae bacterium]